MGLNQTSFTMCFRKSFELIKSTNAIEDIFLSKLKDVSEGQRSFQAAVFVFVLLMLHQDVFQTFPLTLMMFSVVILRCKNNIENRQL